MPLYEYRCKSCDRRFEHQALLVRGQEVRHLHERERIEVTQRLPERVAESGEYLRLILGRRTSGRDQRPPQNTVTCCP